MKMLERAASDGTIAAPMLRPVGPVRVTGQTGSPVQNGEVQRTLAQEGSHQGKRVQGCSRIGRPPRTPSDVAETKEEQQMSVEKARV